MITFFAERLRCCLVCLAIGFLTCALPQQAVAECEEGSPPCQSADFDCNFDINLVELIRVFQFRNTGEYSCDNTSESDDGYKPGDGDRTCAPHSADFAPQDWVIDTFEASVVEMMFMSGGYCACSDATYNFVCPLNVEPVTEPTTTMDYNKNHVIELGELVRVIQLYNALEFHCATPPESTDDGYELGPGEDRSCARHNTDYRPRNWRINLSELLRAIQLYSFGGYRHCGSSASEDGFCART